MNIQIFIFFTSFTRFEHSASKRNEFQECFLGVKAAGA